MIRLVQQLILALIILATTFLNAQEFQGKAYYQTKRSFEVKLDSTQMSDAQQQAIQEMLKKQFEKTYILTFNKSESIYEEEKVLEKPSGGQSGMRIMISGMNNTLYKNTKENRYVDAQEMFGKKFLIKDELASFQWNLENESKKIGNYMCFKATTVKQVDDFDEEGNTKEEKRELKITAWYTPEIPVSNGPQDYNGLPGLILELHEDKMHYVCNKIVINPKEKINIKAPDKGKEVNEEEFREIMTKKQKEMRENFHNGRKKGERRGITIEVGG